MTSQLLELKIEALERRMKALEDALISQSIIEAIPDPDPIPAAVSAEASTINEAEALQQYNDQTEEHKKIAEWIPDETIKKCIEAAKGNFPFIYKTDLYKTYSDYMIANGKMPIIRKAFFTAVNRAGYPDYAFHGKLCIWISDKPKPRPGKRPKKDKTKI